MRTAAGRPFGPLAAEYDSVFSRTSLGQRLRRAVWNHLDRAFEPGVRVLDLGCGTGEDAIHLAERGLRVVAVDREKAMLAAVTAKARGLSSAGTVETLEADLSAPGFSKVIHREAGGIFEGAYSNFGALNCVGNLRTFAVEAASLLPPGAPFLACVMGPSVPWEWVWFLSRGKPREAFRRLRGEPVEWRGLQISYPSIGDFADAFSGSFRLKNVTAVGAFLPPSYAREWVEWSPSLLDGLDRCERLLESMPVLPHLADHYLAWMTRQ